MAWPRSEKGAEIHDMTSKQHLYVCDIWSQDSRFPSDACDQHSQDGIYPQVTHPSTHHPPSTSSFPPHPNFYPPPHPPSVLRGVCKKTTPSWVYKSAELNQEGSANAFCFDMRRFKRSRMRPPPTPPKRTLRNLVNMKLITWILLILRKLWDWRVKMSWGCLKPWNSWNSWESWRRKFESLHFLGLAESGTVTMVGRAK